MQETACACGGVRSVFFIGNVAGRMIDAHDSDCNRLPMSRSELRYLALQLIDDPIDLFDHCLRNDLNLYADFDGCDGSALYNKTRIRDWRHVGNDFAEAAVTPASRNAMPPILNVKNGNALIDALHEFLR